MKIFLVGEGPTDIGDLASSPPYRGEREGFLQPLIRTMVGGVCEFDGQKITLLAKTRVKGAKSGFKAKAVLAAQLAQAADADLLVFSTDADHHLDERRADVSSGLQSSLVPTAIAMPKEAIEAWAMADAGACTLAGASQPPAHPERLWGRPHEPASNHPKMVLNRLLGGHATREILEMIGSAARPSVLYANCPESFRPFAEEVSAVTGRLPGTP